MKLTENQKFIICKVVGVRTKIVQQEDFSYHEQTVHPCAVVEDGDGYKVYVGRSL